MAVKKCLKCIHRCCATVYTCIKGRGEQSIDIQGKDNKKRGGSGQGAAANAWGDHEPCGVLCHGSNELQVKNH